MSDNAPVQAKFVAGPIRRYAERIKLAGMQAA
jgi:hypothetical protein